MSANGDARAHPHLQIVPEKLVEHTTELGEAMMEFVAPAAPNEAAQVFGKRLEKVTHSLEQIYEDASGSARSFQQVADEAFRRYYELGQHFVDELVLARSPAEVFGLQMAYFRAQFELFTEQSQEMQRQFAKTCFGFLPK